MSCDELYEDDVRNLLICKIIQASHLPRKMKTLILLFLCSTFCSGQPLFQASPEDTIVNEKTVAVFRCVPVENGTIVLIGWEITTAGIAITLNDGTPVPGIGRVTLSGDRTNLTLMNVSRTINESTIVCNGVGSVRITSSPATIIVQYIDPPIINVDSANMNISVNGVFTASYTTDSFPPVNNVELLRNGQVLTDGRFLTNTTTVLISDIQCDDNGTYALRVSNEAGSRIVTFIVNVQSAPFWVSNSPITVDLASTNVNLTSQVNGCPDTITITCRIMGGETLPPVVVDVGDNTPVYWRRELFSPVIDSGSSRVTCDAHNGIIPAASTSFTVNYDAIACHDSPLCLGLVIGIVLLVALIVAVIVIVVIAVVIKKKCQ